MKKRFNLAKRSLATLLVIGICITCSLSAYAETAAFKRVTASGTYTVAMSINSKRDVLKVAFRKSGSKTIMKTRLDIMRYKGERWWMDEDGNEPVKLYYSSSSATKPYKLKASFTSKSKKKYNGTYKVYTVVKAPKLNSVKTKYPEPGYDGMTYSVTWDKVSGADGYQCKVYSLCADNYGEWYTWYETKSVSNRKVVVEGSVIVKLKFKVRAYKKVNGIKVYGPWSKTRTTS